LGGGWDAWREAREFTSFGGDGELPWLGWLHWEMKERTDMAVSDGGCFQSVSGAKGQ
jgi:hypothetical protein